VVGREMAVWTLLDGLAERRTEKALRALRALYSQGESPEALLGRDIAPHYQLVVDRPGTLDELSLLCEPAREGLDRGLLQSRLQHALREQTGLSIAVQVLERDRVPRSEGKALRVLDRRAA